MINTIKDIWYALTSPEKYRDFMNYKKRSLLLYVFVLVLISGLATFGPTVVDFFSAGGFEVLLEEGIPDFRASAEEGFWIEEPVTIDEYNFLIKANSDVVLEDITDLNGQFGSYEYVIMVDKEQIYVKAPTAPEISARFDELPGFSFTKADVLEYIPLMYMACVWGIIFMILIDFVYYFLTAFLISWGAGIIASLMKVRIGSKKLFKMSVYAGTFSYLLNAVQILTGYIVPNYSVFSMIISIGYMFFAIKEYKESYMEELPPESFGGREDNL